MSKRFTMLTSSILKKELLLPRKPKGIENKGTLNRPVPHSHLKINSPLHDYVITLNFVPWNFPMLQSSRR